MKTSMSFYAGEIPLSRGVMGINFHATTSLVVGVVIAKLLFYGGFPDFQIEASDAQRKKWYTL